MELDESPESNEIKTLEIVIPWIILYKLNWTIYFLKQSIFY